MLSKQMNLSHRYVVLLSKTKLSYRRREFNFSNNEVLRGITLIIRMEWKKHVK